MSTPSQDFPQLQGLFIDGDLQTCDRYVIDLEREASQIARHPLEILLPHAEKHNRRLDLLSLVRLALNRKPQDCRLIELEATLLLQTGSLVAAEASARAALTRRPSNPSALALLSSILTQAGRFGEALQTLVTLRDLAPQEPGALSNIAYLLTACGRTQEAISLYRQAIAHNPDHPQMRLNHSIALLKAGYFQQGWAEHEWRFGLPGHTNLPRMRLLPNITPDLDLRGRKVLVTQEEGYGDTLMYLRFLPLLAERGAIVTVWGADIMADLCARVSGVATVQVGGDTPDYDYHCPFISLPRAFSSSADRFGQMPPYITPDPVRAAYWRDRIGMEHGLRVGLVWAGAPRPEHTEAYMLDQRRSMPLTALHPLTHCKGITLYSLQKGPASAQIDTFDGEIIDFMPEITSMAETAALVAALDIVVSVDTSVVHLAGAMNKSVLLMDRVNPCWRWMEGRTDSPWYPSMRIIRQSRPWDWSDVVDSVCTYLVHMTENRT